MKNKKDFKIAGMNYEQWRATCLRIGSQRLCEKGGDDMHIKTEEKVIYITTSDDVTFEMNWKQFEELEKAIRIIRLLYSSESFLSIDAQY